MISLVPDCVLHLMSGSPSVCAWGAEVVPARRWSGCGRRTSMGNELHNWLMEVRASSVFPMLGTEQHGTLNSGFPSGAVSGRGANPSVPKVIEHSWGAAAEAPSMGAESMLMWEYVEMKTASSQQLKSKGKKPQQPITRSRRHNYSFLIQKKQGG